MFKGSKFRDWNIFTIHKKLGWQKYFFKFKTIITPRFLYELIVPQDILNIANNVATSSSEKAVFRFIIAASIFNGILAGSAGTVGWGLFAMQAVEVLMAIQIARQLGIIKDTSIFSLNNIIKFFSYTALTALTVIHGFRHSMRDRLRAVECPSDLIDQIGGWTRGSIGEGYGKGYDLIIKNRWLVKTKFKI